jgi:hypothetical protein
LDDLLPLAKTKAEPGGLAAMALKAMMSTMATAIARFVVENLDGFANDCGDRSRTELLKH